MPLRGAYAVEAADAQLGLFDDPAIQAPYAIERCERCGGRVELRRTADRFEDVWACAGCPARGNLSWSRVFGPRAEEKR